VNQLSLRRGINPCAITHAAAAQVLSGIAQVTEGDGRVLVTAVGEHSEWGQTMALVVGESADTPLQEKLTVLAAAIGKVGFAVALLCFVVLMVRYAGDTIHL
jgi:P-type Ca2+ transporter type 2C